VTGPIREPAQAKLNVFLRVLGRREDGYHEIETLVLPLTLADGVEAAPGDGLSLQVTGPRTAGVPAGEDNLVLRAARALAKEAGIEPRARLLVVKHIPAAAGLGGGSADAAAALRALNDLWGCGFDREELASVGARVGSDVPALVYGGPVLAQGRGERIEPVEISRTWWALLSPGIEVAAADAYRWWDEDGGGTGPDRAAALEAFRGGAVEAAVDLLGNDLEGPVLRRVPAAEARDRLLGSGALGAVLCGSGPTVAGLCRNGLHAERVAQATGGIAVATVAGRAGA
jgi:4-diphosphocytidyl-2-C-methyl-D-erythritol kinase